MTPSKGATAAVTPDEQEPITICWYGSLTITISQGRAGMADGVVTSYGDTLELTLEIRRLNTGRDGRCIFDLLDDEAAQVSRWGRVMFRPGPWPEGVLPQEPGSVEFLAAAEAARQAAWSIHDEAQRAAALADVNRVWGRPPVVSRTFGTYPPSDPGAHR